MTNKVVLTSCIVILPKATLINLVSILRVFLWVWATEVNYFAVSSKRVRELEENKVVAEVNISLPELAAFMSMLLRGK